MSFRPQEALRGEQEMREQLIRGQSHRHGELIVDEDIAEHRQNLANFGDGDARSIYIPRGKVFGKVFAEALAQKLVTVELRAAFSDQAIRASHLYEYIMFPVVLALMVIKPF